MSQRAKLACLKAMTTHGWKALGAATLLLGWGVALPPSAEACTSIACDPRMIRFPLPPDAVVPANVPALVVVPPLLNTFDAGSLRLRTEQGADVEASLLTGPHGSGILVPAAPLVPGTGYRLEGNSPCQGQSEEWDTVATTFTAGPAVTPPATSGSLLAGPEQHGSFQVWGGGSCSVGVEGSTVTLGFTPTPELVPFLPWVHWTLVVDGRTWATAPHGSVDSAGTVRIQDRTKAPHDLLTLYAVCEVLPEQPPPSDQGLSPGRHVAMLRPVLEQSGTPLPSLEVAFELTCPKEEPKPEPEKPQPEGCSQAGGGLTAFGLLATLQVWRRQGRQGRCGEG
ncbi:hypothetical protein [Corallococcus sp. CA047B]|uniref:hypothetical protein n=1 Tax=Corallococcus sp. CA047B TaxID=2316729 RepID=UPI0011C420B9|nr:hypothetical protein [Corallococcus sp. CA047B]